MRGYKFELWTIITLQIVIMESWQEEPNLLPVIVMILALVGLKKILRYMKGVGDGYKYDQHPDHLYNYPDDLHLQRRAR